MMGISPQDPHLPLLQTILSSMGTNLFPCGGPTLGLTAKLCNNYVSGIIAIATSEGMNLGIRHGMDPKVLSSIFTVSTAGSVINGESESNRWLKSASLIFIIDLDKFNVSSFEANVTYILIESTQSRYRE